ncbi:hypothetical protein SAMN04488021_12040 [Paracoccus aminovorans]|uniref:Invasion protein IalB, involved in pathogenesis n=1 Tax=Paracoccus aminovorans TaxID=34004 RepID=A0A1I3B978_9RHOB|nr:hypothetical protein [Paracoccus aminovorans]CQR85387.1 hypothetical protein JCM7685_0807 [Paracoccus aminovorans]SFH58865.1 hypothetical protein SAMN04488021_12040 [Paracoccus aminovorans]
MRCLSILLSAVLGLGLAPAAGAWEKSRDVDYPATAQCPSENMCLLVSCPAPGKPSFEMLVMEHGKASGEPFFIAVDGRRFDFILPDYGANGLYRWTLQTAFADALTKGRTATVQFDLQGMAHQVSLRGSSAAIGQVLASCGAKGAATSGPAARLTGLSPETDCQTATSTGLVVDRTLSGGNLTAFRFKDQYGVDYVNVDPPRNSKALQAQLAQLITPGARLRVELHGCGAGASIVVLSSVEAIR